jgi:hypothetical protein
MGRSLRAADAQHLVPRVLAADDLDGAGAHTEVIGDDLPDRVVGPAVDRCGGDPHDEPAAALAPDLVAAGSRDHPDVDPLAGVAHGTNGTADKMEAP